LSKNIEKYKYTKYKKKSMKKEDQNIEKEVDQIQNVIENIETKEIQQEYKKHVPIFIALLKIIIILNVLSLFLALAIFRPENRINGFGLITIIAIVVYSFLFYGVLNRKRWSWNLGMYFTAFLIIFNIIVHGYIALILQFLVLIMLFIHKDYLNK
jgi:hypothetical protein